MNILPSSLNTVDDPARIELRFILGYPFEAMAIIESLNDIDMADVYAITAFDEIHAYKSGRKRWTSKSIVKFLDEIKRDLSYNGAKVTLNCQIGHGRGLIIECEVEERS